MKSDFIGWETHRYCEFCMVYFPPEKYCAHYAAEPTSGDFDSRKILKEIEKLSTQIDTIDYMVRIQSQAIKDIHLLFYSFMMLTVIYSVLKISVYLYSF